MNDSSKWYWWGLTRRRVYDDDAMPTRRELVTLALLLALLVNLVWLILLSLPAGQAALSGLLGFWAASLYVPVGVTLFFVALGFWAPSGLIQAIHVSFFTILARERGWLARWDLFIAVVAAITVLLGALRISGIAHWPASILVAALTLLGAIGLSTFRPAPLVKRPWQIEIPVWLTATETVTEKTEKEDDEPKPEAGAAPLYQFEVVGVPDAKSRTVGIRIDPEVLNTLRRINREHKGQLYQERVLAVVLSQGDPVNGIGAAEVDRLCLQLTRVARKARLTGYQFASSILQFVQRAIRYEFDEKSTQRLLGETFKDYGRFPTETLHDQVGDCECTSLLCAALLARCGFPCAVIEAEVKPGEWHYAVGLELTADLFMGEMQFEDGVIPHDGRLYLYGETATDHSDPLGFGVIPFDWRSTFHVKEFRAIPIPAKPGAQEKRSENDCASDDLRHSVPHPDVRL